MPETYFSKVKLDDGSTVNVKDAYAREQLANISSSVTTLNTESLKVVAIPKDSTQTVTGHTTYTTTIDNIEIVTVEFFLGNDPAAIDYTLSFSGGELIIVADTDGLDSGDIPAQVKVTYRELSE